MAKLDHWRWRGFQGSTAEPAEAGLWRAGSVTAGTGKSHLVVIREKIGELAIRAAGAFANHDCAGNEVVQRSAFTV